MAGGQTTETVRPQRMRFRWAADPDGTMPMATFLSTLNRLRGALYYTAWDPDDPSALDVNVKLVHVEHNKEFLAVADVTVSNGHVFSGVGTELVRNLGQFRSAKPSAGPPIRDMDALNAYQRLTEPLQRDTNRKITIAAGGRSIAITKKYADQLVRVIGPDRTEIGSVSGRLLRVNLYRGRRFDIFPTMGPKRVACSFEIKHLPTVTAALNQYVAVEGALKFKHWDALPYAIDVKSIRIVDQATLPTLESLHGLLPNALGDQTSEEFVDSLREESW